MDDSEIGRASCRERGWRSGGAVCIITTPYPPHFIIDRYHIHNIHNAHTIITLHHQLGHTHPCISNGPTLAVPYHWSHLHSNSYSTTYPRPTRPVLLSIYIAPTAYMNAIHSSSSSINSVIERNG